MKTATEPNKHILFVLDDLANPSKYTQEKKEANRGSAYTTARDADHAADAAAYAADAAAYAADADYWLNRYFEITGEDKQTYIDALENKS